MFRFVSNTCLGGCGHTSVKNILLYWEKAYWNSILAVFKGVCAGINPENWHQNILWILFGNTHAHNRCCIIDGSERSCPLRNIHLKRLLLNKPFLNFKPEKHRRILVCCFRSIVEISLKIADIVSLFLT